MFKKTIPLSNKRDDFSYWFDDCPDCGDNTYINTKTGREVCPKCLFNCRVVIGYKTENGRVSSIYVESNRPKIDETILQREQELANISASLKLGSVTEGVFTKEPK